MKKKEKYVVDLVILHDSPKCRANGVMLYNVSFHFASHMITLKNKSLLRSLFLLDNNECQLSTGLTQWLNYN